MLGAMHVLLAAEAHVKATSAMIVGRCRALLNATSISRREVEPPDLIAMNMLHRIAILQRWTETASI